MNYRKITISLVIAVMISLITFGKVLAADAPVLQASWSSFHTNDAGVPGLLAIVLSGNSLQTHPDLIPVRGPSPGYSYCQRDASGNLIVTVKNQNNNDVSAHASITKVVFGLGGTFELPTPAIQAGGSVELQPLAIPAECFRSDCSFTITVDSHNQVHESNERNNNGVGKCIG